MRNLPFIFALLAITSLCGIAIADCMTPYTRASTIFPMNPSGCAEMPRIPMTFGGCVVAGGVAAPAGTVVEVRGPNVNPNCLVLDGSSCFGLGTFDEKLVAQGTPTIGGMLNIPEGSELTFYVNGERAQVCKDGYCSMSLQYHSGHHSVITLKAACIDIGCPRV
jgi:hypothetical protein